MSIHLTELKSINNEPLLALESNYKDLINTRTIELLNNKNWNKEDVDEGRIIIEISNKLYNNSDSDVLPLDDGIYDLLLEQVRRYIPEIQSGALPENLTGLRDQFTAPEQSQIAMYHVSDEDMEKYNNMMYQSIINMRRVYTPNDIFPVEPLPEVSEDYITKRLRNTQHEHPELVGTLHKCKFVLDADAREKGVYDQTNVKIVERDWIVPMFYNP